MAAHPIFASTFHGDVDRVSDFLDADPDLVSARNAKQLTPLHVAASRGQAEVIGLLLDRGANIDGPSSEDQWRPIVFACYRGHLEAVRTLIKHGAALGEEDGNPIHFAGQRKHKEICKLLVEHGAIDELISVADKDALALFRAAYSYDAATVGEILTRRPELVSQTDRNDRTAMHEACTHGDTQTVRALLKHGASKETKDARGQTPAERASAHRQHAVTKLLEKHQYQKTLRFSVRSLAHSA